MNKVTLGFLALFIASYTTSYFLNKDVNLFMLLIPTFWIAALILIVFGVLFLAYLIIMGTFKAVFSLLTTGKLPLDADLDDINKNHGTNFSSNKLAMGSTLGSKLFFDADHKKICIYTGKNSSEIVDFDYIRSWRSEYTEISKDGRISHNNVFVVLETADINRPILRISVPSKNDADGWMSRLNIIYGT